MKVLRLLFVFLSVMFAYQISEASAAKKQAPELLSVRMPLGGKSDNDTEGDKHEKEMNDEKEGKLVSDSPPPEAGAEVPESKIHVGNNQTGGNGTNSETSRKAKGSPLLPKIMLGAAIVFMGLVVGVGVAMFCGKI